MNQLRNFSSKLGLFFMFDTPAHLKVNQTYTEFNLQKRKRKIHNHFSKSTFHFCLWQFFFHNLERATDFTLVLNFKPFLQPRFLKLKKVDCMG